MDHNTQDQPAEFEQDSAASRHDYNDPPAADESGFSRSDRPKGFHQDSRRGPDRGGRDRREGGGRGYGGRRAPSDFGRPEEVDARIQELIRATEEKMNTSHEPVALENLAPFERKQIHQHFERRKMMYETKTYRRGEEYVLWIFPVANLKKFAESKAQEALTRGEEIALPSMSNYERFIVHNILKEFGSVETSSAGEGDGRHIVIQPKKFGRSLRKIVKKIKLF